jgi:hypothetical protein
MKQATNKVSGDLPLFVLVFFFGVWVNAKVYRSFFIFKDLIYCFNYQNQRLVYLDLAVWYIVLDSLRYFSFALKPFLKLYDQYLDRKIV